MTIATASDAASAALAGPIGIPLYIPVQVQRSTGAMYCHAPVRTTRLVMREMGPPGSGMEGTFRALGTVLSMLCTIPVQERVVCSGPRPQDGLRRACRLARQCVLPWGPWTTSPTDEPETAYSRLQWCIAVLSYGSTVKRGSCLLVSPRGGREVRVREVHDSLHNEMVRMGLVPAGSPACVISSLPSHTNEHNRSIVTLPRVVDTYAFAYAQEGKGLGGQGGTMAFQGLQHAICVPSQSLDVHRIACMDSEGMREMRDGFRFLWARSFELHTSYGLAAGVGSNGEGLVRLS